MSSLQDLRRKQIAEVIDEDKNISRRVFQNTFRLVEQFQDTLKQSSPSEKRTSFEIEKFIIEMESALTEIQNELEQKIAPFENIAQVGNPDVEESDDKNMEKQDVEEEEKNIGSGRVLKGGVRESKISLVELWNKFINYVSKIANMQQFTQQDYNALYDRLDDLIPLLQNISRLNVDAKKNNIAPTDEGIIEILLSKITNKNLSPIIPSQALPEFSAGVQGKIQEEILRLKKILSMVNSSQDQLYYPRYVKSAEEKIGRLRRKGREEDMKKEEANLAKLNAKFRLTNKLKADKESVQEEINKLQKVLKEGRYAKVPIKSSRQPLRGEGKTASSQILKHYGDDVYRIYESIPSLSYDELEDLYLNLQDRRKFAAENDDRASWDKLNFLITSVLADDRAKDMQRLLGNGMKSMMDNKYGHTGNLIDYKDADNEMYAY